VLQDRLSLEGVTSRNYHNGVSKQGESERAYQFSGYFVAKPFALQVARRPCSILLGCRDHRAKVCRESYTKPFSASDGGVAGVRPMTSCVPEAARRVLCFVMNGPKKYVNSLLQHYETIFLKVQTAL
tara:strand:+ start:690 stop:1070 length:381 start_codon:yes stop_codon:yes gene_type:complete